VCILHHHVLQQGHWAGGQTLVDFIQWCKEDGVQVITAYAFSTENWSRDPLEVQTLMAIFAKYAESFRTEALAHNVKVNVLSTGACVRRCWLLLLLLYHDLS
jgi:tritrans,polycis-undecaprenyl-diphosphate synthase [geranylgeranyl-diphosphate specific]